MRGSRASRSFVVILALALVGCGSCDAMAGSSQFTAAAPRAWPYPQSTAELVDPSYSVLAASGTVVVFQVTPSYSALSEEVLAYDIARRTTSPLLPATIGEHRIVGASFAAHGVSADGRYVALTCTTMRGEDARSLAYRVCVRDRVGDGAWLLSPPPGPGASDLSVDADVWLSGDGSTVAVRSVGQRASPQQPRMARIFMGARDDAVLREGGALPDLSDDAFGSSVSLLGLSHDGATLLFGTLLDPASDDSPAAIHVVREGSPQRIAADLDVRSARFRGSDGTSVELVLRSAEGGAERRSMDLASGIVGPAIPTSDEEPLDGPVRSLGLRHRAELRGRAVHVLGAGGSRTFPLPAEASDPSLLAVSDDAHVLASATIGGRRCLALVAPEPVVIACTGLLD